jgi:hypothetical protein
VAVHVLQLDAIHGVKGASLGRIPHLDADHFAVRQPVADNLALADNQRGVRVVHQVRNGAIVFPTTPVILALDAGTPAGELGGVHSRPQYVVAARRKSDCIQDAIAKRTIGLQPEKSPLQAELMRPFVQPYTLHEKYF